MQDILFNFFLTSLSVSCLIPFVSICFMLFKNRLSVRSKYYIWIGVILSLLLPFRPAFSLGLIEVQPPAPLLPAPRPPQLESAPIEASGMPLAASAWSFNLMHVILLVWLLGVFVYLGRQLYSYFKFRTMLKRWGDPVEDLAIWETLAEMQDLVGVKREIGLIYCPLVHSPLLFGFRKPTIVLPELDYTEEEFSLIFHHELVHYKHGDVYVSLLAMFIKSLYWYNPLVRFASKELLEAGEMYCDATVLAQQDVSYRIFYGETILTMIDRSKKNQVALTTCFYSNRFNLKRRILAIMDNRYPIRFLSVLAILGVATLVLLSRSVFVMAQPPANQVADSQISELGVSSNQARDYALAEAGLTLDQVQALEIELSQDRYFVAFQYQNTIYQYQISLIDGQILRVHETNQVLVSNSQPSESVAGSEHVASQTSNAESSQAPSVFRPLLNVQSILKDSDDDESDDKDDTDDSDDPDDPDVDD